MRVIAGSLGGRTFDSPRGQRTHPMSERLRGALFNALGDIAGLTVLDAFAGSGALAFEALSRGATRATLIEPDRQAQAAIAQNISSLGVGDRAKLVKAKAAAWLATSDQRFDIVLCDPPYDAIDAATMEKLAGRANPGGIIVCSLPPASDFYLPPPYEPLIKKDHGDATLSFWRR